jgi:hypothetical protein
MRDEISERMMEEMLISEGEPGER